MKQRTDGTALSVVCNPLSSMSVLSTASTSASVVLCIPRQTWAASASAGQRYMCWRPGSSWSLRHCSLKSFVKLASTANATCVASDTTGAGPNFPWTFVAEVYAAQLVCTLDASEALQTTGLRVPTISVLSWFEPVTTIGGAVTMAATGLNTPCGKTRRASPAEWSSSPVPC